MPQRVVIDAKFEIPVILDGKEIIKVVNKKLLENSEMHMIYLSSALSVRSSTKTKYCFRFRKSN